jgi:pilus assembly protein CpaF
MFAIVISEKGGAERREAFDKHEINVGRVQGNDLMLPKGNVSKRHARLLFRDGRVIVTDLKSTNGTYVNGRKIAQATIVREGDKIYVGDYVLRVELSAASPGTGPSRPPVVAGLTTAPSAALPSSGPSPRSSVTSEAELAGAVAMQADANESTDKRASRDLSDVAGSSASRLPATPANHAPQDPAPPARTVHGPPVPTLVPRASPMQPNSPVVQAEKPVTTRSMALSALVERVADAIDLAPLSRGSEPDQVLAHRIERVVREKGKGLRDDGHLPDNIEIDDVIRDVQRELFGLGAIEPLLEDDDISEIRVFGHNRITALRSGETIEVDPPFSSESALFRAIVRLCRQSPTPLAHGETIVERYLPKGLLVEAILPPVSQYGHALVITKRRRAEHGLDDLVRSGTISRAMATFLQGCIAARANLLLVGSQGGKAMLLSALALASHASDQVVALQSVDELWGMEPAPLSIRLADTGEEAARLVRAATKLHPGRLIVNPMAGEVAAAVASAIAEGCEGVLAGVSAPSLRHALERLVPDLMAARPGMTTDAARGWLLGSFELAVEIARLPDGRHRVMHVAELEQSKTGLVGRDVFTFVVERTAAGGAIEGSFAPTGIVPRIANDLAARGGGFDLALFKRDRG